MDITWTNDLWLFLIGTAFSIVGYVLWRKRAAILKNGVKASGEVAEVIQEGKNYYPVIQFLTSDNINITHKYFLGSSTVDYFKGDKVMVIYNSENPSDFVINESTSKVLLFLFAGLGAGLLISSIVVTCMILSK